MVPRVPPRPPALLYKIWAFPGECKRQRNYVTGWWISVRGWPLPSAKSLKILIYILRLDIVLVGRHKLWVLVSLTWYFYKRNSNFLYYFSPVLSIPTLHHNFCTDQSFKLHTDKTKYISHLCKESVCAVCTTLVFFLHWFFDQKSWY